MGKIRRERQKFHQSINKGKLEVEAVGEKYEQILGKSPLLKSAEEFSITDNLFEGIDINFDNLKKKLVEDDRMSIKSIAKSCKYDNKGKLLTKKEKQKLKHDLFMRKINTTQQLKKEALQKHKKRKGLRKSEVKLDTSITIPSTRDLEDIQKSFDSKSEASTKKGKNFKSKGIKKMKVRQKEMLQEISSFRKILTDLKHTEHPELFKQCFKETQSVIPTIVSPK